MDQNSRLVRPYHMFAFTIPGFGIQHIDHIMFYNSSSMFIVEFGGFSGLKF